MDVPAGLMVNSGVIVRTKGKQAMHSGKSKWLPKWGGDKGDKDNSDLSMRLLNPADDDDDIA